MITISATTMPECIVFFVFKGLNTLSGWNSSDDVDPLMNEAPPLCLVGLKSFFNEYYLIIMFIKIN